MGGAIVKTQGVWPAGLAIVFERFLWSSVSRVIKPTRYRPEIVVEKSTTAGYGPKMGSQGSGRAVTLSITGRLGGGTVKVDS